MSGETWAYSYIAARHRRLAYNSPVRHMCCTYLGKPLTLHFRLLLLPQEFICLYNIPYYSIIKLPIHILPYIWILTNPFGRIAGLILLQSMMPLKTRSTPVLDGNTMVIWPQNALGSSTDESVGIPVASKPPFEF